MISLKHINGRSIEDLNHSELINEQEMCFPCITSSLSGRVRVLSLLIN